jgi:hypothetical protein
MAENNNKSLLKKFISLLGLLLIGAIGSGLWDIFLKDLLYNIGNIFVDGVSFFYSDYINSLYENIGKNASVFDILPGVVIITLFIGLSFFFLIFMMFIYRKAIKGDDDINKSNKATKPSSYSLKSRKILIIIAILISLYNSITYTNLLIKEMTTLRARNYIERTSEIIHPNITEEEYLKLRSSYRQIDNKEKFENTLNQIISYAEKDSIVLPEIKFYGINIRIDK